MECDNCVRSIESALRSVPGVVDVVVNLNASQATVDHHVGTAALDQLKTAVEDAGFDFDGNVN